jgi:hypothetical protein
MLLGKWSICLLNTQPLFQMNIQAPVSYSTAINNQKMLLLHELLRKYVTGHILKQMCEGFEILKLQF